MATVDKKRSVYFSPVEIRMRTYKDYEHIFRRGKKSNTAAKERELVWEKNAV